jgi:hypothetical protein
VVVSPESTRRSLSRELSRSSVCLSVCKDVCRNPGGIIKLQARLLKEGSGQKQDIVLRTHLHVLQESKDFYKSISYGCKRSKILGKIQVSMALFSVLLKYINAMTFLVFNLEANNVLL